MIPSEAVLPLNSVVLYEQDGEPWLALVLAFKNAKYNILNEKGRQLELAASRLSSYKINYTAAPKLTDQQSFLQALSQQLKNISNTIELEDLWQAVIDGAVTFSVQQLSEMYFGSPSAEQSLAMHIRLLLQKIFFKRDREKFVARTAEIVEELKKAELAHEQKALLRTKFIEWVKSPQHRLPDEIKPLVDKLQKYAVQASMSPAEEREARDAAELALGLTDRNVHKPAPGPVYALLEKLNIFDACTNPAWIRSGLQGQLSSANLNLSEDTLSREDFRNLDSFTIDDDSTQDMDDALSLELTENGYRIGIHISDVASFISKDTELDKILKSRLSSVYLPEKTINMLPEGLSNDHFSLKQGADRPVISLLVEMDRTFNLLSYRFTPAVISVKRRWSYNQVDQMLEQTNSEFNTFYEMAGTLESKRIEQGAMQVNKHQINIKVDKNGSVSLQEEEEHGPARSIIAEMAILYNRLCADSLSQADLAAVFRGQEAPEVTDAGELEEGRARDYNQRVKLKPSSVTVYPQSHSSLGLKAYLQVTSPIRRYSDLVNQRQLISLLSAKQTAYNPQDLEEIINAGQDTLSLITKVSKESRRFWMLRYLEQRIQGGSGRQLGGVVVKIGPKLPLVELDEVFFCSFAKSKRKVAIGEVVNVQIASVHAAEEYLRLEIL